MGWAVPAMMLVASVPVVVGRVAGWPVSELQATLALGVATVAVSMMAVSHARAPAARLPQERRPTHGAAHGVRR